MSHDLLSFIFYIIWTAIHDCCCLLLFSLFHSLSALFSVLLVFLFHCIFLRSRIFTTVLLIIGRQPVELLCFSGGLPLHGICLHFDMKIWQINWWWWWWWWWVDSLTVLGVTKSQTSFWPGCFKYYWQSCKSSLWLENYPRESLHDVTRATLIARLKYDAPAGLVGISHLSWEGPIQSVIKKSPTLRLSASQFPWCL